LAEARVVLEILRVLFVGEKRFELLEGRERHDEPKQQIGPGLFLLLGIL
jgi:hypothetical protein